MQEAHLRRVGITVSFFAAITLTACGASSASKAGVAPASATSPLSANGRTTPNRTAGASAPTARAAQTPRRGVQISARSSRYGRILRDGRDQTIYLFTRDPGTPSTCYAACATAWPPGRSRTAGSGIRRSSRSWPGCTWPGRAPTTRRSGRSRPPGTGTTGSVPASSPAFGPLRGPARWRSTSTLSRRGWSLRPPRWSRPSPSGGRPVETSLHPSQPRSRCRPRTRAGPTPEEAASEPAHG